MFGWAVGFVSVSSFAVRESLFGWAERREWCRRGQEGWSCGYKLNCKGELVQGVQTKDFREGSSSGEVVSVVES